MTQQPETAGIPAMDNSTLAFAVELFSALGHPVRIRIIELLADGPRTVGDVAQTLNILQPNASQHLAILNRSGVVRVTPVGAMRSYALVGTDIPGILAMVDKVRAGQNQ